MGNAKVKFVKLILGQPPDKGLSLCVGYDNEQTDSNGYGTRWEEAAHSACLNAIRGELDQFSMEFETGDDPRPSLNVDIPPNYMKGENRIRGYPMLVVEKRLRDMRFECRGVGKGLWLIHRPDPSKSYSPRGYFDATTTIRLATGDASAVDEAIHQFSASRAATSPTNRYLNLGGSMAKKDDAEKADKEVKEKLTVKDLDGDQVEVSPKQKELYDAIKERSATDSPVGSDDERLDDPSSIAAMKLATEKKAVVRYKPGKRWLYFANEKDMSKHQAATEKAAAEAAASKKKSSAAAAGSDSEAAAAGKKKSGPIPKPGKK